MSYRTRVLIAITLIVLFSVATLAPTISAQQRHRFRANTGVVTLAMGQVLRITIASEGFESENIIRPRFAWMRYGPMNCNSQGVCRQMVQSQGTTAPVNINQSEAASFDMQGTGGGVRVEVFADYNADGIVDAADLMIINTATGEVVSHVIMANTEGDFH
jgi:hypothetical protein